MTGHSWGRSQKYHARPRQLYALLFNNGCAYIGQSVDLREREKQHRRPSSGWRGRPFQCVQLSEIYGTEEEARDHEHAWRHKAATNGWQIYAKPPAMIVNHHNQMNAERYDLARSLRWPAAHSRNSSWGIAVFLLALGVLAWLAFM